MNDLTWAFYDYAGISTDKKKFWVSVGGFYRKEGFKKERSYYRPLPDVNLKSGRIKSQIWKKTFCWGPNFLPHIFRGAQKREVL